MNLSEVKNARTSVNDKKTFLTRDQQLDLYFYMQLNRMLEERLTNLYRQGKVVGGLYRSLGQEATSVGSAYALGEGDLMAPMIRNLGSLLVRGVKPGEIFCQYMARAKGPTMGKDCNLHFGDLSRGLVAPISHLGDLIPVMAGVALAAKLQKRPVVALTYIGDGGTSTGSFHEGLNFAAVQKLPLIVVVENNQYAYSTPLSKQMAIKEIVRKADGYGVPGETVDGNDVLAVYEVTKRAVETARMGGGVTLIEARTMRMRGHAEHDDFRYVPRSLLEEWKKKDPVDRYEKHLLQEAIATQSDLDGLIKKIQGVLDAGVSFAEESPFPDPSLAYDGVYADRKIQNPRKFPWLGEHG